MSSLLTLLRSTLVFCSRALAAVGAVALILMMVQTVGDVISKHLFNLPLHGNQEVVSNYYMTAVVFLPMAIVELKFENINVDMFTRLLSCRAQSYLYGLTSLIAAGFFLLLMWQTLFDALQSTERGEILMGSALISIWPAKWILPASFAIAGGVFISNGMLAFADPRHFNPNPQTDDIVVE